MKDSLEIMLTRKLIASDIPALVVNSTLMYDYPERI
jgi:hypothetical protein